MTPKEIQELRDKRARLVEQCRAIATKAQTEKRGLTSEEQTNYDKIFAEQRTLAEQIKREEELLEAERQSLHGDGQQQHQQRQHQEHKTNEGKNWGIRADENYNQAFNMFLRHGDKVGSKELRDLSMGEGTKGGFLAPKAFVNQLIKAIDDILYIRQLATKMTVVGSNSLGCPSLDTDIGDGDWTPEVPASEMSSDSAMSFGLRELVPHLCSKLVKSSRKLLANPAIDAQQIIINRLAYKMAVTQEKAFMTGNGVAKPLGLFTASNNGIDTSRDIATGNETTSITFLGLNAAKYSLKSGYRKNAQWLFHRDAVKQVAGLTDDNGQFIWQPSKAMGEPDMLLGHAIMESEYAPNTFTTGLYAGILGDFSYYWIADSLDLEIQVLMELFAGKNQVGHIGRTECDGMPVLAEAFSRVKLA